MLENMFVGRPPGNYDRLLDFSRAVTGNLFFVPSATFLEEVTTDASTVAEPEPIAAGSEGSLSIGSLKGDRHDAAPAE
jgi:putative iron-dependent peroxidase